MGKLDVLASVILHPKQIITLGYQAMMRKKNEVSYKQRLREKHNIEQLPTVDFFDLVEERHETVYPVTYYNGTSMPTIIMLMKSLARKRKDCAYLEIGSLRGESMANMSDEVKDCTSITLPKEEMKAMNFPEGYIKMEGMFVRDKPNITFYKHNSHTFDFDALNKKFDIVLVDGDNSYNGILQDTSKVFKLLKNDQSVIVWHSYAQDMENEVIRHDVLAGIMDAIPKEEHGHLYHVSNTTCAIFIRGKYKAGIRECSSYPNKVFTVTLDVKPL